jgi:hypothetical protein
VARDRRSALDVAPALSAVVAAPACCWVRHEHALDVMAVAPTVLASEGECASAQSGSAWQRLSRQPIPGVVI